MSTRNESLEDSNIQLSTGKLAFGQPLLSLDGSSPSFGLDLSFDNSSLYSQYSTWNKEAGSGRVGAGWHHNMVNQIIMQGEVTDPKYHLLIEGKGYELELLKPDPHVDTYQTKNYSNNLITRHKDLGCWQIIMENGLKYVFGVRNDMPIGVEKGDYDPAKGTYTHASDAYLAIRKLLSNPNPSSDIPENPQSDNTLCLPAQNLVTWKQHWHGPSLNDKDQKKYTTHWDLSYIEDNFENRTVFYYIQHIQQATKGSKSFYFTLASYLYKIESQDSTGTPANSLELEYGIKDTCEYAFFLGGEGRPNGHQQRFEKLYLSRVKKKVQSTYGAAVQLISKLNEFSLKKDSSGTPVVLPSLTSLKKRQLLEVKQQTFSTETNKFEDTSPGHLYEYYGSSDGVHVSNVGFDNAIGANYSNNITGALYGNIKSIVYPDGLKKVYKYSEQSISSLAKNYRFNQGEKYDDKPVIINTNYNYTIMINKLEDNGKWSYHFNVLSWTSQGWKHDVLGVFPYSDDFNHELHLDYNEKYIAFMKPDLKSWQLFRRNQNNDNSLDKVSLPGTGTITPVPNYVCLTLGEDCFSLTNKTGILLFQTKDNGETWSLTKIKTTFPGEEGLEDSETVRIVTAVWSKKIYILCYISRDYSQPYARIDISYSLYDIKSGKFIEKNKDFGPGFMYSCSHVMGESEYTFTTGNLLRDVKRPGKQGQMVAAKIVTRVRMVRAIITEKDGNPGYKDLYDGEDQDWLTPLFLNQDGTLTFPFYYDYQDSNFNSILNTDAALAIDTIGAQFSSNGFAFSQAISYDPSSKTDSAILMYTYNGSEFIKSYRFTKDNCLSLLYKDNSLITTYESGNKGAAYYKNYYYCDWTTLKWHSLDKGKIDYPSKSSNHSLKKAMQILGYFGLGLSILLLPFGFGAPLMAVITCVSLALTISTYAVTALYENSAKLTLDPSSFGYLTRFINDGTTIWFREDDEMTLRALGSGESFQEYDSLTGTGSDTINGKVLSDWQPFGPTYKYVSFLSDKNHFYYRNIKNGLVSNFREVGSIFGGLNDVFSSSNLTIYYIKGRLFYSVADGDIQQEKSSVLTNKTFDFVDAAVTLSLPGVEKNNSFFFSGNQVGHFKYDPGKLFVPYVKTSIQTMIKGSEFLQVDSALCHGNLLYLFRGCDYETVEYKDKIFSVKDRSTIDKLLTFKSGITPFDGVDAVWIDKKSKINIMRHEKVAQIAKLSDTIDTLVSLPHVAGVNPEFSKDFQQSALHTQLSIHSEKSVDIHAFKRLGDDFLGILKDYVIKEVEYYYDKDAKEGNPTSVTKYEYDTSTAYFIDNSSNTAYGKINVIL